MIFPKEESSGEINKKYCKRRPGGVKLPGLFLPFLQKKNLKWSLSLTKETAAESSDDKDTEDAE